MNKETIKQMKEYYEGTIAAKMVELLNVEAKNVAVNWGFDKTTIRIDATAGDTVTIFGFTYTEENLQVEMEGYKVLYGEDGDTHYINGVQNKKCSTDFRTLYALYSIIGEILNSEMPQKDEADVAELEYATIVEEE